ncbi:hypothetical protein HanPSC8_Chr01g0019231 [Helianthus annuus]|nr:hypothetical protein HanPSC8_Chr01g0019231 [Helianthus annuus]
MLLPRTRHFLHLPRIHLHQHELHFIHSFTRVPMQESIPSKHSHKLLAHTPPESTLSFQKTWTPFSDDSVECHRRLTSHY